MHRLTSAKFLFGATLAVVMVGAATVAEARPEIYLSIGVQGGPVWVEQGPVYVQPQPVYVQPQPRYSQPPVFDSRAPVFVVPREAFDQPRWGGDYGRDARERHRAWRRAESMRHERDERFGRCDRDHDDNRHHHRGHRD